MSFLGNYRVVWIFNAYELITTGEFYEDRI